MGTHSTPAQNFIDSEIGKAEELGRLLTEDSEIERTVAAALKSLDLQLPQLSYLAGLSESAEFQPDFAMLASLAKSKRRGRPRKTINWQIVDFLCFRGAGLTEIASQLGISSDTLERAVNREKRMNFAAYSRVWRIRGAPALRARIWDEAMKGDKRLLRLLAREYLGLGKNSGH
jgi:hypothetical protein